MSLSLYMDHHVHGAITAALRQREVDVLTCQDDGTVRWPDDRLLERATGLGRVLFSQDDDLLAAAHERLQTGQPFAGLIYGHQLKLTIGQAIRDLQLMASVLDAQDMVNRVEFLPLD